MKNVVSSGKGPFQTTCHKICLAMSALFGDHSWQWEYVVSKCHSKISPLHPLGPNQAGTKVKKSQFLISYPVPIDTYKIEE